MRARSVAELRRSFSKSWGMVIDSSFLLTPRGKADADATCSVRACGPNNLSDSAIENSSRAGELGSILRAGNESMAIDVDSLHRRAHCRFFDAPAVRVP